MASLIYYENIAKVLRHRHELPEFEAQQAQTLETKWQVLVDYKLYIQEFKELCKIKDESHRIMRDKKATPRLLVDRKEARTTREEDLGLLS